MSKKLAKQKKMTDVEASLIQLRKAEAKAGPKALILTPQIAVAIQGDFPSQDLFVEVPNGTPTRKKVLLTPENAYRVLMDVLMKKAGGIELDRQLSKERNNKALKRGKLKPQFITIATHPQAVIREGLVDAGLCPKGSITVLPTRASQLKSLTATKSLEDMGL